MRHQNRVLRDRRSIAERAAMIAGSFVFVDGKDALVLGPDRATYWAGNLIPMVVIVIVVVGTVVLVAREGGKVLDSRDQPPSTWAAGAPPRGARASLERCMGYSRASSWSPA